MTFQPPDLSGKVAVVLGASRGIGKSMAIALGRAGCKVAIAARTIRPRPPSPGSLMETQAAIEQEGGTALPLRTNLRHASDLKRLIHTVLTTFGRIDILVHNAGALWWGKVAETPLHRLDLLLDINLRAPFQAAQLVIPPMARQGGGQIVFVAPPVEREHLPGKTAYLIGKYGLTHLGIGLAEEVREYGIGVQSLWPATLIESQATIHFQIGKPEQWRKPTIMADALLALVARPASQADGRVLLDEDVLRENGVTDFTPYDVVPGGKPVYIAGEKADATYWRGPLGPRPETEPLR